MAIPTFDPYIHKFLGKLGTTISSWDFTPIVEIGSVFPSKRRTFGPKGIANHGTSEHLDSSMNHSSLSSIEGGREIDTEDRRIKGWRRSIPQDQTLEVTFRVVGFENPSQVPGTFFLLHDTSYFNCNIKNSIFISWMTSKNAARPHSRTTIMRVHADMLARRMSICFAHACQYV